MRVELGTFARAGLEARFGIDLAAGVDAALRHYTRRLRSQRTPLAVPAFRGERPKAGVNTEVDLSVSSEVEAALETEADRQEVPVSALCVHAVLIYLADIDAAGTDGHGGLAEEDLAPARYLRGCNFLGTGFRAKPRRQVGSA